MLNINHSNAIIIVFIICSIAAAVAQPLPREKPVAGPPAEILAAPDAICVHWTDDCRACAKLEA